MEHETTFDLNFTLLKREFFLKFVRKATSLESKIRNLNNFSYSTEKIDQFYGGLKTFLLDLHGNFQKVCPILKLFLTGVGQILEWLKLVRPHIQGKSNISSSVINSKVMISDTAHNNPYKFEIRLARWYHSNQNTSQIESNFYGTVRGQNGCPGLLPRVKIGILRETEIGYRENMDASVSVQRYPWSQRLLIYLLKYLWGVLDYPGAQLWGRSELCMAQIT